MTKSNSRRFVRAAWSLLFFQVIASAGAVAVTGWAAFHVQSLVSSPGQTAAMPTTTGEAKPAAPTESAEPATTTALAPAQSAEITPTPPPPADAVAPSAATIVAAPQIAACPRMERFWRVPAQTEWCDTGIAVRQGQQLLFRFGEGRWSNAGPPSFGQNGMGVVIAGTWVERAPLGALIGRVGDASFLIGSQQSVISPADGHLLLAMNDVRGTYSDNQGWLDVYIAGQ